MEEQNDEENTNTQLEQNATRILPVFILVVLVVVNIWALPKYQEQYNTINWDETEGNITSIGYEKVRSGVQDDDNLGYECTFTLEVEYAYEVNGQNYKNDIYSLLWAPQLQDNCESNNNWIVEYAENHPTETPLDVYVDPQNPERSVLKNGLDVSNISAQEFYAIVIVICDIIALLFIFNFVKNKINKLISA